MVISEKIFSIIRVFLKNARGLPIQKRGVANSIRC